MSGTTDDIKGRAKEAAGAVTGDDELKREGKTDQKVGSMKDKIHDVAEKAEEGIDAVRDKLHGKQ